MGLASGRQKQQVPGMGATAWAHPRLCRLILPVGVFLLLLCFSSLRLQHSLSACILGGRPCHWFGETPSNKEDKEKEMPPPASPPTNTTGAPLLPLSPADPQDQSNEFHIKHMQRAFTASLMPSGQILIWEYLSGWKELIKFMDSLGAAFGLISRETQTKIAIMQQHQNGPQGPHYHTLQSMVNFELAKGLVGFQSLPAGHLPSGCRTLLRLHRALKWLELFLHKLGTSEDRDPSQMCADAYREALAPYHSWWVRQVASLAFMALPSRQDLYHIICLEEERKARTILQATVHSIARVYNITHEVYAAHGMLDLP
ncbi:glycolipid transfer protein domain-containing protein 2 isoform X2 [Rhineura floridana]|uniref:glycolipid transfer protein domain-containing protein 2 isoform X2 n=1 Tax=Rhineura floridana TaxID=261503 RepID=UPI002AC87578|nr:glycolipid transfer protein domain-containing protein 2 isoform X2 [Rhineura floridana]